jgi:hypothetical protein
MPHRRLLWLLILFTLLWMAAVWFDVSPALRGPNEWRWTLRQTQTPAWRILIPIGFLGLYVTFCARRLASMRDDEESAHQPIKSEHRYLAMLTLAAPLIQLALAATVWRYPLFEFFSATVSPSVTGFYSVAVTTPDLPNQLTHYTSIMPYLPIHPQTHPPGVVMIQWLGWRLFQALPTLSNALAMPLRTLQCHNVALMGLDNAQLASSIVGMLVPAAGALAVWPMYAFGRRVVGRRGAALAVAVFPLLPTFAMWPSQWDQVFPLLMFAGLYWLHTGLEGNSWRRLFLAGASFSIATFLSLGNAIMIVVAGLYALLWAIGHVPAAQLLSHRGLANWLRKALAFALGCLSIWVLYAVVYGVHVSELLAVATQLAFEASRCPVCPSTTRSYGVWVIWNVIDFAEFLSIPVVVLIVAQLRTLAKAIRAGEGRSVSWLPLAVATLLTFAVLDISGIVRGEVSRIWAYFGPLFLLLACTDRADSRLHRSLGSAVIMSLVAAQLITMNTRWMPYPSFLDEPPVRVVNFIEPQPQVKQAVSFDHQIKLLGYDVETSATHVDLTLYWQALTQPPHAYTVFVHVLNSAGQPAGQLDNMPMNDQLPTSCWQPGEIVADYHHVPVASRDLGSVQLGLYRLDTGERLQRDDGQGDSFRIDLLVH